LKPARLPGQTDIGCFGGQLHACHRRTRAFIRWRFWAHLTGNQGSVLTAHDARDADERYQSEEKPFIALGRAATKIWNNLPRKFSIALDEAISFRGEAKRQPLAKFLHGKHSRTTDALKAEAVLEPDNPGG
jgi:hypothetical protein